MTELGDQLALREAQARYFELNGLGTAEATRPAG